ncbi:transcription antitermination factor NusB [Ferrovibrio sp.]|uniref:RsmB/NOP family class I SAM-dependent RNA methyltransferase n=1 Tax=Ferrovibrio sp. TaxID=1917215 RepID=UPI00260F0309|nr:transcription antitermination factor NusB [Ferrovibrio sp.]
MSAPASPIPVPPNPRRVAASLLDGVLGKGRALDDMLADPKSGFRDLADRDRAFVRRLVATALRRRGQIDGTLRKFLTLWPKGLPREAMRLGAAELLFLDAPPHAAVDSAVDLMHPEQKKPRGLINAVLRKVATEGATIVAQQDAAKQNTPDWLWQSWERAYGPDLARDIALAHLQEAPLDISVKGDAALWADKLQAELLPSGSLRRMAPGAVENLPGYAPQDGKGSAWWVQDAAAALPAKLLGDVAGKTIADLCAAPGGKTAQLAVSGAIVTAVDRSAQRLRRLEQNLARLDLKAEVVVAEIEQWQPPQPFDGVLLDAPCSATGTIRRHPDLPYLKDETDVMKLAALQRRLIAAAWTMLKPGGRLVYCVCSLQPEEGENQMAALRALPGARIVAADAATLGVPEDAVTADGALRSLPCHWAERGGMDGFFAVCLEKSAA